jgi:hypothetical protein
MVECGSQQAVLNYLVLVLNLVCTTAVCCLCVCVNLVGNVYTLVYSCVTPLFQTVDYTTCIPLVAASSSDRPVGRWDEGPSAGSRV